MRPVFFRFNADKNSGVARVSVPSFDLPRGKCAKDARSDSPAKSPLQSGRITAVESSTNSQQVGDYTVKEEQRRALSVSLSRSSVMPVCM